MRKTAETVITQAIIETMRSTPTGERGRRVIRDLDEAGYAIVPKFMPTGRVVEVTYRNGEDTSTIQRHAEFFRHLGCPDVAYDPLPNAGFDILAATVLDADLLDLRSGAFIQDGKVERYPADLVRDWRATMAALPLHPATRPTGDAIDVVVLMPDGSTIPMTHAEFNERANYRAPAGVELVAGATYELPPGTVLPPEPVVRPGEPLVLEDPHHPDRTVFLRPVPILAVFYEDGIIQFAGDANEFAAFRDMAAKVVDPSSRAA